MSEVNVSNATFSGERIEFTKEMRKDYTILIPDMLPVHFKLIRNVLTQHGYRVGLLKNTGRKVVDTGLKYVREHNMTPDNMISQLAGIEKIIFKYGK